MMIIRELILQLLNSLRFGHVGLPQVGYDVIKCRGVTSSGGIEMK